MRPIAQSRMALIARVRNWQRGASVADSPVGVVPCRVFLTPCEVTCKSRRTNRNRYARPPSFQKMPTPLQPPCVSYWLISVFDLCRSVAQYLPPPQQKHDPTHDSVPPIYSLRLPVFFVAIPPKKTSPSPATSLNTTRSNVVSAAYEMAFYFLCCRHGSEQQSGVVVGYVGTCKQRTNLSPN